MAKPMLYELFTFTGMIFWLLIGAFVLISLLWLDNDDSSVCFAVLFLCIALWGFSNTPIPNWKAVAAYFVAGLGWWFIRFNINLSKIRTFMRTKGLTKDQVVKSPSSLGHKLMKIYESEPSFESFVSRTLLWPVSIFKYVIGDFAYDLYKQAEKYILSYKERFLFGSSGDGVSK
jgi:hypothetical protein